MIWHKVQGLQVVPPPIIGKEQVVHLAGKDFLGLEDENVQDDVSQRVVGPDADSMLHEQPHKGQRMLPKVDGVVGAVMESCACSSSREASPMDKQGSHQVHVLVHDGYVSSSLTYRWLTYGELCDHLRGSLCQHQGCHRLSQRDATCTIISSRAPLHPKSQVQSSKSFFRKHDFSWLPEAVETLEPSFVAAYGFVHMLILVLLSGQPGGQSF